MRGATIAINRYRARVTTPHPPAEPADPTEPTEPTEVIEPTEATEATEQPTPRTDRRPGRRGRRRIVVAIGLLAAVSAVTLIVALAGRGAMVMPGGKPTSSPGVVPPSIPSLPAAATAPGSAATVDVPVTVDPTGRQDVTDALQAVLDAAPDGATIRFMQFATYRVDGTLRLQRRSGLLIDGNGATLHPTTVADFERRTWSLLNSTDITFVDVLIVGAHPSGGTYIPEHEHEHGFGIEGGGRITIERARITDVYGDCVYVSNDEAGTWADGVRFIDSSCARTGRNGVAVVGGRNVEVARSSFESIALFPFDVEPNQSAILQGASGVSFHDNRIKAPIGDYVVAANGWGAVDGVTVSDNIVTGVPFLLTVHPLDGSGYRRSDVVIARNHSDTPATGKGPVMDFDAVDRLSVTDNVQLFSEPGVFALVTGSCNVTIERNEVGGATQAQIESGSCP